MNKTTIIVAVLVVIAAAVAYFVTNMGGNVVGTVGLLNASQIMAYAAQAGFQGSDLDTAIAIALAESGGDPNAYNPETAAQAPTGKGSFGLWQIYLNAHPEFASENLYDPQTNANAAYRIYQNAQGQFTPWSTYKNGAYAGYLGVAQGATGA